MPHTKITTLPSSHQTMNKLPTYFLAHGSPTNAIENNHFTQDWHNITANLKHHPEPKSIVVFSAHWQTNGTQITANQQPKTIHDFGGFSQELHNVQYPCQGKPQLAATIQNLLSQNNIESQLTKSWGLDHGTWVILKHLYPKANIPVLQISLDASHNDLYRHYTTAQSLKPLREQGVLFIGSGNIVHNISKWMTMRSNDSTDWATQFDAAITKAIQENNFDVIAHYQQLPFADEAVPTIEHFLPLIYCLGLSGDQQFQLSPSSITHSTFPFNDLSTACSRSLAFE